MSRTLANLMDLSGRVALITGGAGHIGSVLAAGLAELGARLVLVDLAEDRCLKVGWDLEHAYGAQSLPLGVDLTDAEAVRAIPDRVQQHFGQLDIVVNCAALVGDSRLQGWVTPFDTQGLEAWRMCFEVNLTAPFVLIQAALPLLRASGHGSIINVASIYGLVGPDWRLYEGLNKGNPAAYGASKGGLLQFTRWLSTTLAPEVRVNAITPGGVFRDTQEPFLSRYVSRVPLGRMATEEDFKGAVAYLASDASSYVTGQNLVIDGGWTSW